jgi:RNA polymerase sigma-70 factor (ECF subfamily)
VFHSPIRTTTREQEETERITPAPALEGLADANRGRAAGNTLVVTAESDARVIAASLHEPARFGAVFDRHATVVFRYLVRRVGVDDAETLLAEVFRVAFEKRATYDGERSSARPWLYGIATNVLARHRRSEARRIRATARLLARRPAADDAAERVAATVDARALWPRVAAAVAQLPDGERDALLLYAWEELSYEEVATALDVPVGTVRSRLNRARRRLRELQASIGRER